MRQSAKFAVPATLFAAGAFAAPGHAKVVDITATSDGTGIDLVGDSTSEYEFYQNTNDGSTTYSLEGKYGSGNKVGPRSSTPYYPSADTNLNKTQIVTDGYYGLSFTAGQDFPPTAFAALASPTTDTAYVGYAKVDQGGSHISEIDFKAVAAVPETETWAMMILGLGAAGAMMRRRRQAGAPLAA